MPTLRASTPASIRFLAWAAVTTAGGEKQKEASGNVCKGLCFVDIRKLPKKSRECCV